MSKVFRVFILLSAIGVTNLVTAGCLLFNGQVDPNKVTKIEMKKDNSFKFKELDMQTDGLHIKFEGKDIGLEYPAYIQNNRYYIPLSEIINKIGGEFSRKDNELTINLNGRNMELNMENNTFKEGSNKIFLKEKIILTGDIAYISMFDFTNILNLKTDWDYNKKTISFYYKREYSQQLNQKKGKTAFIRLEDISVEQYYNTAESLEKLRIIADYLYSKGVPFHVAWVPRYVDPPNKIDNDPSTTNTINNADFIYTLDYLTAKNGIIGLHGYTHQHGMEKSLSGVEFSGYVNADGKSTRQRVEKAINAAKKLDIPVSFFESPHYAATYEQRKIISSYFNFVYEHALNWRDTNIVKLDYGKWQGTFIPAPLDCLNGEKDVPAMISKMKNLPGNVLRSFFYHPHFEFKYIQSTGDNTGYPLYSYNDNSILKRLVQAFEDSGYQFKKITEF